MHLKPKKYIFNIKDQAQKSWFNDTREETESLTTVKNSWPSNITCGKMRWKPFLADFLWCICCSLGLLN